MLARMRPITTALVLAAAATMTLSGCARNQRLALTDLETENQELRDRNDLVEQALNDAEARNGQLQQENTDLRGQLVTGPTGALTGFEGAGATVSTRNHDIVVTVAGDVLFASGSADLRKGAKSTLSQIASVLNSSYSSQMIEIAGHTDSDPMRKTKGKWQDNENLSAQRALAVERFLASRGVDGNRMHVSGFGPSSPRGSKQDSRRVEIIVLASVN